MRGKWDRWILVYQMASVLENYLGFFRKVPWKSWMWKHLVSFWKTFWRHFSGGVCFAGKRISPFLVLLESQSKLFSWLRVLDNFGYNSSKYLGIKIGFSFDMICCVLRAGLTFIMSDVTITGTVSRADCFYSGKHRCVRSPGSWVVSPRGWQSSCPHVPAMHPPPRDAPTCRISAGPWFPGSSLLILLFCILCFTKYYFKSLTPRDSLLGASHLFAKHEWVTLMPMKGWEPLVQTSCAKTFTHVHI